MQHVVEGRRRPSSLRGRLVLIPTAVLLLGLLGTVGVVLLNAKSRIAAEITSGLQLGDDLVATALRNVANAASPAVALHTLAQDLPRVRHVRFELVPAQGTSFDAGQLQLGETQLHSRSLLAQLLSPPPVEQTFPVVVRGETVGELRLHSNAADEIAEIIGEVELIASALLGLCLLIVGGLLWTVWRSLGPVQLLAEGFDRLEHGDFRPLAPIPLAELERVGHQFNRLAESLSRVTADNHHLIDKLLSMQDQERKELAAELHDEFGPVLFGIRTEAACIMKSVSPDTELHARAHSISELTDGIQKVNYRMLDRLRPLVLEQMGLPDALRQLVTSWQTRYPHIIWSLDVPQGFRNPAEAMSMTLYRIVQESATNAIRHAEASAIDIRLRRRSAGEARDPTATTAASEIFLSVRDNGRGFPVNPRRGFGLLGMMERVRQLGGILTIGNTRPGAMVEVTIPEVAPSITVEPAHADPAD